MHRDASRKKKDLRIHGNANQEPVNVCRDMLFQGETHGDREPEVPTVNVGLNFEPLRDKVEIRFCGYKDAWEVLEIVLVLLLFIAGLLMESFVDPAQTDTLKLAT